MTNAQFETILAAATTTASTGVKADIATAVKVALQAIAAQINTDLVTTTPTIVREQVLADKLNAYAAKFSVAFTAGMA